MYARLLSLFALLVISGCASFSLTRNNGELPAQHRLIVPPYYVFSDSKISSEDPIVEQLWNLRKQLQQTLSIDTRSHSIELYLFSNRDDYQAFLDRKYPELPKRRAFFVSDAGRRLVFAYRNNNLIEDLRHEACHALTFSGGLLPLWLDEGLAEYFESPTPGVHAEHRAGLKQQIRNGWRPQLAELERLERIDDMGINAYRESWAWTSFLLTHSEETRSLLLDYLQSIRAGNDPGPFSEILARKLPEVDDSLVRFVVGDDAIGA